MSNYIYEEKLFSKLITGLFALVVGLLIFALIYQIYLGPIGTNPAPNEALIIMIIFFAVIGVNFSVLKNGWYKEFVFSTRNPQEIIKLIN